MIKIILVLVSLSFFIAISFAQQTGIERLRLEVDGFREEIYILERDIISLQNEVTELKEQELNIDEVWEGFNFSISLTGMRVFIGMFLDSLEE